MTNKTDIEALRLKDTLASSEDEQKHRECLDTLLASPELLDRVLSQLELDELLILHDAVEKRSRS